MRLSLVLVKLVLPGLLTVTLNQNAEATVWKATSTTIDSVFKASKAGDTIRLYGIFGATSLHDRDYASALTVDARNATFINTLAISRVSGLTIIGGHFGSASSPLSDAIRANGSRISFLSPVIIGDGTIGRGIRVSNSDNVTIDHGTFTGLRIGVSLSAVTDATLNANRSLASSSDGFDIADSHNIMVSGNSCSGTNIFLGAHPDCVQLWSIAGHPPQSDITIIRNTAVGATQGFTSFNGAQGGGLRIKMQYNRVNTSYPQGVACYECVDSVFTNNIITTQPGARFQTKMHIIGGRNNIISDNSIAPSAGPNGIGSWTFSPLIQDSSISYHSPFSEIRTNDVGEDLALNGEITLLAGDNPRDHAYMQSTTSPVPEPFSWVFLSVGLVLAGSLLRRQRISLS